MKYDAVTNLDDYVIEIHAVGCSALFRAERKGFDIDRVNAEDIYDWPEVVFGEVEEIDNPADWMKWHNCTKGMR